MMPKLITRPYGHETEFGKSGNVAGINQWARNSRIVGFLMLIFGWFTIPFEVIFRRDFGQRWFTVMHFCAGIVLIIIVSTLQFTWVSITNFLQEVFSWLGPFNIFEKDHASILSDRNSDEAIGILFMLYWFMGMYHLFKIRWRNQANVPLHSFDDGTSRLLWFGKINKWFINVSYIPVTAIYWLCLPYRQRKGTKIPKVITDTGAFTNTVIEPMVVFMIAFEFSGVFRVWLFLSSFALFITAQLKEMTRHNKMLDFQDSKIEAQIMREHRAMQVEQQAPKSKTMDKTKKTEIAPTAPPVKHPPLNQIIEQWQKERQPEIQTDVLPALTSKDEVPRSSEAPRTYIVQPVPVTANAFSKMVRDVIEWFKRL